MENGEEYYTIIEREAQTVYKVAFSALGNKADSDDIFQEVFLRYIEKRPSFENTEHEKAWFIRVTINCCKKFHRLAWKRKTVFLNENIIFENTEENELAEALASLKPQYRIPIHLFYYEGYSTDEIAKLMDKKPSTIRMRLSRGRAILREKLKNGLFEENNYE